MKEAKAISNFLNALRKRVLSTAHFADQKRAFEDFDRVRLTKLKVTELALVNETRKCC